MAFDPLKESALPNFPALDHVAPFTAPVWPFPLASATLVPVPSSNPYAATRPPTAACVVAEAVLP